ncbi:MAG: ANTAR domain-containing protein [Clostridiales bacterium]|nr:ANTAR domain-containing protein [Clostridiales bacterium]
MESAIIVSSSEKGTQFFTEMLNAAGIHQIVSLQTAGEVRRHLMEKDYDLVIINSPLRDETGESLSQHIASRDVSQVMLVVNSDLYDAVSAVSEDFGVMTISKPVNKAVFWSALKLAGAAQSRLKRAHAENTMLKKRIEDIRVVDRAKCILISSMNMSEKEAHRYIEKRAMDMRISRRAVAEEILENV